jgi:hypothetical protein
MMTSVYIVEERVDFYSLTTMQYLILHITFVRHSLCFKEVSSDNELGVCVVRLLDCILISKISIRVSQ